MVVQINLAAARVNAGLKQEQAAKSIGITPKTLGNYEKGKSAIPYYRLKALADLYKIPSDMIRIPDVEDGVFDEDEKNLNCSTF